MGARVTAAAVQVQVGGRTLTRFRGDPLPEGVAAEVVDRLVRKGMVAEGASPKPARKPARKSAAEKAVDEAPASEPSGDEPADEK